MQINVSNPSVESIISACSMLTRQKNAEIKLIRFNNYLVNLKAIILLLQFANNSKKVLVPALIIATL